MKDEQKLETYVQVTEALLAYPTHVTRYGEYSLSVHDKYSYELLRLTSQYIEILSHPEIWHTDIHQTPEMEVKDEQAWLSDNVNSVIQHGLQYAVDRVASMPLTKTSFVVLQQIMDAPFDPKDKFYAFDRMLDRMRLKTLDKNHLGYLRRMMIQLLDLTLEKGPEIALIPNKTRMQLGTTSPQIATKIAKLVEMYEITGKTDYMKVAAYFLDLLNTRGRHIGPILRRALRIQLRSDDPKIRNAAGKILAIPAGPNYKPRRSLRRRNPYHFG
jgi:hypothetical protein